MNQFSMNESRRRVLEKIPDYAVSITPADKRITVTCRGQVIADSTNALLVRETRHDDVYYLPQDDIRMDLLAPTDHSTFCPFKGHASYWRFLDDPDGDLQNFVWSYLDPDPEVLDLGGYLAFYADKVEIRTNA